MELDTKQDGQKPILSSVEIDAIGEILNISMGSAATAVSTMLDRQVIITTPKVEVQKFHDVSYAQLEPAIMVKIKYVEGISGENVMVFRQSDMQIILNLLMGNEDAPAEDFVFDELSMSAACEVMNQMMGASATALSEFLGKTINISTPEANILSDQAAFESAMSPSERDIVSVSFNLNIEGVMNSDFISIMSIELARMIVNQVLGDQEGAQPEPAPVQQPAPAAPQPPAAQPPAAQQQPAAPAAQAQQPQQPAPPQMPGMGQMPGGAPQQQMPGQAPDMAAQMAAMGQMQGMGMPGMGQMPGYPAYPGMYPPYGYPPQGMPGYGMPQQPAGGGVLRQSEAVNVQQAQFPTFNAAAPVLSPPLTKANMDLVMNVSLNVTVEIGKTKRKIKEIMDFSQGTVIELEKQAGAPVDIVVNGQLLARGDVVVIDDNFGVRITEIVGTKELIDAMGLG